MARISSFVNVNMEVEHCWVCGCTFGIESNYAKRIAENGKTFHCPNGCKLRFGEPQLEVLKRKLERAEQRTRDVHIRKRMLEKSLSATQGVITRMKNRTAAGVCPCCKRTFKQLARHMKGQHPTYAKAP